MSGLLIPMNYYRISLSNKNRLDKSISNIYLYNRVTGLLKRLEDGTCTAKDFNRKCPQKAVLCDLIESQVIQILKQQKPPAAWRRNITQVVGEILGDCSLEERLAEIKATIERMDFRWDQEFITDGMGCFEKRVQLQKQLEQLILIPEDNLTRAVDTLENFTKHWKACNGDPEAVHRLVKLIITLF
jgi:hypothetical protein